MNVNLDVLELIFGQLDGSDLVASALVCRTFLAGAIPFLYSRIEYTTRHAKRAQDVLSPFATLVAHDHLVVHVKHIALHAAPLFQPSNLVSPLFLDDLAHALRTATNLRSFVCTVKILPPLLPHLVDKHGLHHLRIHASLGSRQMAVLQDCTSLQSLSLDFPSWTVIDALPNWTVSMKKTLAHLTLFMSQDTDASVLHAILAQLPRLCGLHVIGCSRVTHVTVLKALSHTPDLRELSFTIFPSQENALPILNFCIPSLTHLSIDIRASYPGLKSVIARIITLLSPRDALAICGGWIGEIKGSSEHVDTLQDAAGGNGHGGAGPGMVFGGGGGPFGQNLQVWQGHVHLHGPIPGHVHGHGHENGQPGDPPLLSLAVPYHGNHHAVQHAGEPPGNPALPPNLLGFPPLIPLGNPNGNNDNNDLPGAGPANPSNADLNPDPNSPSLVSSLPSTLSILHLPQLSPVGLREVIERCEGIQVLGIAIGNAFASPAAVNTSKMTNRIKEHPAKSSTRPEVSVLAGILARARVLRELIIGNNDTELSMNSTGASMDTRASGPHGTSLRGGALLTPLAVRMLMQASPCLRRIVGEGRVWESRTPTPSSPVPFPHRREIDITLSKAHYGPGAGNNHAHGPSGFGIHRDGCSQVEPGSNHWFWLADSMSGDKV